jgi:hypothetical protein
MFPTRRERIDILTAKLSPKVKDAIRHVLDEQREGNFLRESAAGWWKARVFSVDVATLIALEAVELLEGGALVIEQESGPRAWKVRLYPKGEAAVCGFEVDAEPRTGVYRGRIRVAFVGESEKSYELGEALAAIARELRAHLGFKITVDNYPKK